VDQGFRNDTGNDMPSYHHPKPSIMELGDQLRPVPKQIVERLSMMPDAIFVGAVGIGGAVGGAVTAIGDYAREGASPKETKTDSVQIDNENRF